MMRVEWGEQADSTWKFDKDWRDETVPSGQIIIALGKRNQRVRPKWPEEGGTIVHECGAQTHNTKWMWDTGDRCEYVNRCFFFSVVTRNKFFNKSYKINGNLDSNSYYKSQNHHS
jgi:hypothetical protein